MLENPFDDGRRLDAGDGAQPAAAVELVASKRDGDGRWPLETRYPRAMPVERQRPS